ncbi:MAG: TonB-dependent receptor [Bryobacteraceae bacterium]|nr:TonB-dependent receptor [Bryobacteraceae bacterium]
MRNILLLLALASGLFAQGERGELNGIITDSTGAALPGVTIAAVEVQTKVETRALSTESGVYRIPYLQPGIYKLTVSKTGFRSAAVDNVTVRVAQTLTVDFKLDVGQVNDSVSVSAEPPLIETGTAEIGRYVSEKEFDTWPVAVADGRRQIQSFIFRSLPGTVGGEFRGSINGGQAYSHEILVDGMALGRFDLQGGSNNEFSPSAESVSEFKLQTGTIGAQYGGGQTAVANFALKTGTNSLHGTGYYYLQNDALRANSFNFNAIGRPRNPFKLSNLGASIGGPVMIPKIYDGRNKTFFHFSFEKTRVRDFSAGGFITLPTVDFKQGNFARLLNPAGTGSAQSGTAVGTDALGRPVLFGQIYDPSTTRTAPNGQTVRDPFPGNIVPQARWDPVSANILRLAPITDPINGNLLNNMISLGSGQPVFDEKMYTAKGDHVFSDKHRMSISFNHNDRVRINSPGGRWGNPPNSPTGVYQLQATPGFLGRFNENWTITPSILNRFAIGYNRFGNANESVYVDQDWASKIGLKNTAPTTFPALTFGGQPILGGGIGAGGRLGSENRGVSYNGSWIIQDDVTVIRGKHSFKMGFELRKYYQNNRGKSGTGTFAFNATQTQQPGFATQTGHAFASFLLGAVDSTSRAVTVANPGYRLSYPAFYFSDDWKVSQKLTLNLGLRWEIIGAFREWAGRMTNLDPSLPNDAAGGRAGALIFADQRKVTSFQSTNYKQISPRAGFAYAFTPKFVMRGGYGINNIAPVNNFSTPSTFGYNGTIAVNSSNTPLRFAQDPVMFLSQPYPSFPGVLPNQTQAPAIGQGFTYIAPDSNRLGIVQNFNLGFQIQLPRESVFEASYIGNRGQKLTSLGLDALNQLPASALSLGDTLIQPLRANPQLGALPFPTFNGSYAQSLRRFPQYTGVGQFLPNFGRSSYDSLQLMLQRRMSKDLSALVAYTFSKNLSNTVSVIDGGAGSQDVYNRALEKSVTDYNPPQVLKITWIYALPFGRGKLVNLRGVADAVLGGWTATGIHQYRSGDPIIVSASGANNAIFNQSTRPDWLTDVPTIIDAGGLNTGSGTPYLNPKAFARVPFSPNGVPTRLGTAPRVLPNIRTPAFFSEDVGVAKSVMVKERLKFEIRADAFNLFNRARRGGLVTDVSNVQLFGRLTGQQVGPRSIQAALRVEF